MSDNLYGAEIYIRAAIIDIDFLFVTLSINLYMVIPDKITVKIENVLNAIPAVPNKFKNIIGINVVSGP